MVRDRVVGLNVMGKISRRLKKLKTLKTPSAQDRRESRRR